MTAPTLTTLVARSLKKTAFPKGSRLLVAVSGGADSTACLHALHLLRERFSLELFAHGVDHGLRAEAAAELDAVAKLSESLQILFSRTQLTVPAGGDLHRRARDARYEALEGAAAAVGACAIVTAHHRDDRAETVLERLLHGAHLEGLGVLPMRDGSRFRPLIEASRDDVLAHCARHQLPFSEDPSNDNRRFLRARLRAEVLPILRAISPQVDAHLAALADDVCRRISVASTSTVPLSAGARRRISEAVAAGAKTVPLLLDGGIPATVVVGGGAEKIHHRPRKHRE